MSATRYRIDTGTLVVVAVVHGNGGVLVGQRGLDRLRAAADGKRPTFYEPLPGHAKVYPNYTAESDGESVAVPVLGAVITIEEPSS